MPLDEPGPPLDAELPSAPPPPASARDDELLPDPSRGEHHRGRLAGYEAGRRARRLLMIGLGFAFLATASIWIWYANRESSRSRQFQLPPGTDLSTRPRVFTWSEGKAQLGLSREPPGVEAVELPDRTLRLAAGSDLARFRVDVAGGETKTLYVVSGEIVEELKPGARPLLPAPR